MFYTVDNYGAVISPVVNGNELMPLLKLSQNYEFTEALYSIEDFVR